MQDEFQIEHASLFDRLDREVRNAEDPEKAHEVALELLSDAREAHESEELSDDDLYEFVYWTQVAWLRLRWGAGDEAAHCPFCGTNQWTLAQPVSVLTKEIGAIPSHFGVSCNNCGQMVLVSAQAAGLAETPLTDADE